MTGITRSVAAKIIAEHFDTSAVHVGGTYDTYADREKQIPMNGTESFFLYSSSKPITCTAVLQLYEQGKILLTDPISDRRHPNRYRISIRRGSSHPRWFWSGGYFPAVEQLSA